jgi:putative nucleotidyltransferase with HDIG domain
MASGKDKPSSLLDYRRLIVLLLLSFLVSLVISIKNPSFLSEYEVGEIARTNIRAPSDINIPERNMAIKKGEIIVREGERINAAQMDRLLVLKELRGAKTPAVKGFFLVFLLLFISVTIIYEYADRNIKKFSLARKDLLFASILILFATALVKFTTLISEAFISHITVDLFYVMPIFLFGIIIRIVLFSEAAMVFSLVFAIAMGFAFRNSYEIFLYTFLGNLLASYFSGKCEGRNTVLKAGLYTAFAMTFVLLLFSAFFEQSFAHLPLKVAFILINGVGSSFIALGLLPVVEHVFDYTTDIKLLELANFEHPLLEEMMVNAPGTYHHSIVVGNLSRAAAESIGAHPILTRVSAYYHDVGKLKMPHYFIENSTGFDDAHQSLSPNMSALIILSHTKEGVELAHKYKLGTKIEEIITQHHGSEASRDRGKRFPIWRTKAADQGSGHRDAGRCSRGGVPHPQRPHPEKDRDPCTEYN